MNYNVYIEEDLEADIRTLRKKFPSITFETTVRNGKQPTHDKTTSNIYFSQHATEKNGYKIAYAVPEGLPTSVDYWITSVLFRLLRRVKSPPPVDAAVIDSLFRKGHYQSGKAYPKRTLDCGVIFFKPRSIVTPNAVADLQSRLADCGYAIFCAKAFSPTEIKEKGLARKHYLAHSLVAERGNLLPQERINLLRIYDKNEFSKRFHQHAWDVPVMPVHQFMQQSKVAKKLIKEWSERTAEQKGLDSGLVDAANEISDCKYVNVFQHPDYYEGKPVFLVNPHMLSVIDWFESMDNPLYVFFIHAVCDDALSWDRMRKEFCGASDPVLSLPGSIRKDCYEGLFPVKIKSAEKAKRIFNCIHLSNGVYESLRESAIWFEIDPLQLNLGKALQKIPGFNVRDLIEATYINHYNNRYALTEITNGKNLDACINIFKESTLVKNITSVDNSESLRRVDIAHRITKLLLKENPSIIAIFVSGSASLNRASKDSDMDLIIVTNKNKKEKYIERRFEGDVVIECEWLTKKKALEIAKGTNVSELKGLRESARIYFALPTFDPSNLKASVAELAKEVKPNKEGVLETLTGAYVMFQSLLDDKNNVVLQWEKFRAIADAMAVLNLQLSPVRYHKPKWVVQDLQLIHKNNLCDFLLHCYSINAKATKGKVKKELQQVKGMIHEVTTLFNFPTYEMILKHGYLDEYPQLSYLCRCLMDAYSLFNEDYHKEAAYCGKFVVRLLATLCLEEVTLNEEDAQSSLGIFLQTGNNKIVENYRALFPNHFKPTSLALFKKCATILESTKQKVYQDYSL